jgi:aspartate racemase
MNDFKTIGIIGGMGPLATYDLAEKILDNTVASCDQDNIPVLIDCNTRIADRTAAILHGGADPRPEMKKSAKRLEEAGADVLIMACNTAHYFYDSVCEDISIPVLHMPRLTAQRLLDMGVKKAGVLATDGTCESGVYGNALKEEGVEPVYPSAEKQKIIMSLIYDHVKAGIMDFSDLDIDGVLAEMQEKGAEALILGCTELPMAFDIIGDTPVPVVDPTEVLARAAVSFAGAPLKNRQK